MNLLSSFGCENLLGGLPTRRIILSYIIHSNPCKFSEKVPSSLFSREQCPSVSYSYNNQPHDFKQRKHFTNSKPTTAKWSNLYSHSSTTFLLNFQIISLTSYALKRFKFLISPLKQYNIPIDKDGPIFQVRGSGSGRERSTGKRKKSK